MHFDNHGSGLVCHLSIREGIAHDFLFRSHPCYVYDTLSLSAGPLFLMFYWHGALPGLSPAVQSGFVECVRSIRFPLPWP